MATLMTNREKLLQMYDYAIMQGKCKNRKSFAELIGISDKNLSNALSTNEKIADRFCTNGLLNKANAALNYAFAQQWLQDSTGEMYAQNNNVQAHMPTPMPAREETPTDKYLENLEYTISVQKETIELQRYRILQLEKECENLKKELATVSRVTTA